MKATVSKIDPYTRERHTIKMNFAMLEKFYLYAPKQVIIEAQCYIRALMKMKAKSGASLFTDTELRAIAKYYVPEKFLR